VTCLVTGATGNVGSLVTQRLIERGDRPAVFVRDPKKARELFGDRAYAEAFVDIWRAIREGRLATVTEGVPQVLGRKPITFDQWAEEHAGAFRRSGTTRGTRGRSVWPPSSPKRPR